MLVTSGWYAMQRAVSGDGHTFLDCFFSGPLSREAAQRVEARSEPRWTFRRLRLMRQDVSLGEQSLEDSIVSCSRRLVDTQQVHAF